MGARRMRGSIELQGATNVIAVCGQAGEDIVCAGPGSLLEKQVQGEIHLIGGALHRRCGDDGRHGDPFVSVDVTVDAAEIDQERREAQRQEAEDDSEGEEEFLSDRTIMEPAHAGLV